MLLKGVSSTCDVDAAANEFIYSLRKKGEHWRYFKQRFALYPSAMEKRILSVKCQTVRPYLTIDALHDQNSNGHNVTHI